MPRLQSALDAYREQQRFGLLAVRSARRLTGDQRRLYALLVGLQIVAVEAAAASVDDILAEQGISTRRVADVEPRALAGTASDGRPLASLLAQVLAPRVPAYALDRAVLTQVQDAGRTGAALAMAVRPSVTHYTRMLNPPSCSRCAILAGRIYATNAGFQRHPGCDCRHIPTSEDRAGDLTTDTKAYFDSLSEDEQNRIFTRSGAEAIRLGADPAQVVNARRGMSTAQINPRGWKPKGRAEAATLYGRDALITNEGTTRRGSAYRAIQARHGAAKDVKRAGERYSRTSIARPMPETILEYATSPADAIRLLKVYGYIL